MVSVRFSYNEDNSVIMTVTGSVSQLRGFESFREKQLFPGYRTMGLNRNSACFTINSEHKQLKLSESSIGIQANGGIAKQIQFFTRLCFLCASQWAQKETEKMGKPNIARVDEVIEDSM